MTPRPDTRASGQTAAQETTEEESKELDTLTTDKDQQLPEERDQQWRTPGFSRMRTDWRGEDKFIVQQVKAVVDARLRRDFDDAYRILFSIYELVREPATTPSGEVLMDGHGLPLWKKDEHGLYIEDYKKLLGREAEHFLFALTTRLVFWQEAAADAWSEAMFAKAQWEERFSIGFDTATRGTTDAHRTANAKIESREERYYAVMLASYSRKADALCKSLELLAQRLKDSLTT